MQKLLGFSPDVDSTVAGMVSACTNMVPHETGFQSAPSAVMPSNVPVLSGACLGAAVATKLDGTRRTFAGTATKLYEIVTGAWEDVSTGSYTSGSDSRWSFAQFGNTTLATNGADVIQRSIGDEFAAIADAVKAKVIFSVGSFVMALNTSDATYGVTPNRWWCCASFDDNDWTPSVSTLCTTGELVSASGAITAGGRLGEYAVAYKERAIYLGQFVGAPAVWDWVQVPGGEAGCVGQDAWCDIGGMHFIVGKDNIYLFDGSRPVVIGVGQVRQWFYAEASSDLLFKTICVFDPSTNLVWTYFVPTGLTALTKALVYHTQTKQWGVVDLSIESVVNYVSASATIDGLDTVAETIDELSSLSFDSRLWNSGARILAVFDTTHQLQLLQGDSTVSGFTTGDLGDDEAVTLLKSIRIRFAPGYKPTTAAVQTSSCMEIGDTMTARSSGSVNDGKFDVLQSARWHRAAFTFEGNARVLGIAAQVSMQGKR